MNFIYIEKHVIASPGSGNMIKEHPQNITDKQLSALKDYYRVVNIILVPDHLRKSVTE